MYPSDSLGKWMYLSEKWKYQSEYIQVQRYSWECKAKWFEAILMVV